MSERCLATASARGNLLNTTTMIFDHVSVEFAQWNNIDSVGAIRVTIQHSIIADPIGQQFAAHTETGPYTWYGNLFANATIDAPSPRRIRSTSITSCTTTRPDTQLGTPLAYFHTTS